MGLVATRGGVHAFRPEGGFVLLKAGDSFPEWASDEQRESLLADGLIAEVVELEVEDPADDAPVVDLDALTIAELTAYATEHSIDLGDVKLKADIIAVIAAATTPVAGV